MERSALAALEAERDALRECEDPCPGDPENTCLPFCLPGLLPTGPECVDSDGDGQPDFLDPCPMDPGDAC